MEYRKILGATDFSEHGDLALTRAVEMAVAADARLVAMHVLPEPEAPSPLVAHYDGGWSKDQIEKAKEAATDALRERVEATLGDREIEVEYTVCFGDPANEILEIDAKRRPDLIVVSTHGRRGWQRFIMGSVAERVLQLAKADVLAVRKPRDAG